MFSSHSLPSSSSPTPISSAAVDHADNASRSTPTTSSVTPTTSSVIAHHADNASPRIPTLNAQPNESPPATLCGSRPASPRGERAHSPTQAAATPPATFTDLLKTERQLTMSMVATLATALCKSKEPKKELKLEWKNYVAELTSLRAQLAKQYEKESSLFNDVKNITLASLEMNLEESLRLATKIESLIIPKIERFKKMITLKHEIGATEQEQINALQKKMWIIHALFQEKAPEKIEPELQNLYSCQQTSIALERLRSSHQETLQSREESEQQYLDLHNERMRIDQLRIKILKQALEGVAKIQESLHTAEASSSASQISSVVAEWNKNMADLLIQISALEDKRHTVLENRALLKLKHAELRNSMKSLSEDINKHEERYFSFENKNSMEDTNAHPGPPLPSIDEISMSLFKNPPSEQRLMP